MHTICKRFMESLVVICLWLVAGPAMATTPFSITGHIQSFTLDSGDVFSSAKMVVNGITVTLPRNTVVFLPANLLTPKQLFDQAPAGTTPAGTSGLAFGERGSLADQPYSSYEVAIDGNIVNGVYIAGLVQLHNEIANISSGFIRSIDYGTGELCVGASSVPLGPGVSCAPPDMRVRLNDPPPSRFSSANQPSPDVRFTVDQDNPTIHAKTGYPMCVPNVAPPGVDPKCPDTNRPRTTAAVPVPLTTFVMSGPTIPATAPGAFPTHPTIVSCRSLRTTGCDPDQQAPVLVGDFLDTISGTLFNDGTFYISAHTINANLGIYTKAPSSGDPNPTAYVDQEVSLIGTNGPDSICTITAECQSKIRIVGFMTDPTRLFQLGLYAIDVDSAAGPTRGTHRTRKLPVPLILQGVFGRFRFESRVNQLNLLTPGKGATREYMVRIDSPAPLADGTVVPTGPLKANGLVAGQYVAPMNLYIFPEALVLGAPPPPNNFQCLAFLTAGWTTASIPGFIGQLSPFPGVPTPAANAAGVNCSN
jgi:hypothetical protein